ncbi:MAG: glycosyltransferase [Eubacteriales bacterium]|nr:glycosyltransferase [Eubacteriales bacterium]
MSIKVCHLTSTHGNHDQRILIKECVSLSKAGYEVYQVAQGEDGEFEGIHLIGTGETKKGAYNRLIKRPKKVYRLAKKLDVDIYQIHDMELLPYAVKLKRQGKKVIFDYHEDFASRFADTDLLQLPRFIMRLFAKMYVSYEKRSIKKLDAMISVTPHICDRLKKINPNTVMITNYPMTNNAGWGKEMIYNKSSEYICFAGQISSFMYCLDTATEAIQSFDGMFLKLCGPERRQGDVDALKLNDNNSRIAYEGILPYDKIPPIISGSRAALITCIYTKDTAGNLGTLGNNKLFEAMLCGVPVICTDFELWKDIIEKHHCGICVEPRNAEQLKNAIQYIIDHPEEAEQMGKNGRLAALREYNWGTQETVLLKLYNMFC